MSTDAASSFPRKRPAERLRIVVTGMIAQYPLGGMTWDFLNYVLGFARMGHDVYYIEDNGQWPYNPTEDGKIKTCDFNVDYLSKVMASVGLGERWAYCFGWKTQWFGVSDAKREEIVRTADLVINVSGTLEYPEKYRAAKRLVYIDTDPVFTQLKLARGMKYLHDLIAQHDVQFSFGECLPGPLPDTGFDWKPTRQPVVLSEWETTIEPRDELTTVLTWVAYKAVEFEGRTYGQKDIEFRKFLDLPVAIAPTVIELAANAGLGRKLPFDLLAHKGWKVVDPRDVCPDMDGYRDFIQRSKGEWSIAKNGYVEGQSGWFSCRSACYLAAGRPVVLQDTGFSSVIPTGEGVLAFSDFHGAVNALQDLVERYALHAQAARSVAEDWFDAAKVLEAVIDRAV